jgi:hypothetical protein
MKRKSGNIKLYEMQTYFRHHHQRRRRRHHRFCRKFIFHQIKFNFISILYYSYILYDENFLGHQIKRNFMHQFNIIFIQQMNETERET